MKPLVTARLTLRPLTLADAPWVLALLNEPAFLANIGDKGARDEAGARRYLEEGPLAMYAEHGLGLLAVEERASGAPLGLCGLLKRPTLDHPDLGYALFPAHWGRGHAREACAAVLQAYRTDSRVLAIVKPDNAPSIKVLTGLGFVLEGRREMAPGDEVLVYAREASR